MRFSVHEMSLAVRITREKSEATTILTPGVTREQARADVFDYIERFYNPFRKHSKLDYLSPVQFEERQRLKG